MTYIEWQEQYVPRAEVIVTIITHVQIMAIVLYIMVHIPEILLNSHKSYYIGILLFLFYAR